MYKLSNTVGTVKPSDNYSLFEFFPIFLTHTHSLTANCDVRAPRLLTHQNCHRAHLTALSLSVLPAARHFRQKLQLHHHNHHHHHTPPYHSFLLGLQGPEHSPHIFSTGIPVSVKRTRTRFAGGEGW